MINTLLVGSTALEYWVPNVKLSSDVDIFVTKADHDKIMNLSIDKIVIKNKTKAYYKIGDVNLDITIANDDSTLEFIDLNQSMPIITYAGIDCHVASIESLLALKRSHRFWPINWFKTIRDYHALKSKIILSDDMIKLSDKRAGEKIQFKTKLNMLNSDFFDKSQQYVSRIYDHDSIHRAVAFYDTPLFEQCKNDKSKAMLDKSLFDDLSFHDKCKLVQEEAFVIALERYIIPDNVDTVVAFKKAMRRICTTLTSGWFREFAVDNYFEILQHDYNFVNKFKTALKNGNISSYEQGVDG